MARRGQPDVELAEKNYVECWDQFQTWASRHTSELLRFDHPSNLDEEDEEELDESLFQVGSRNNTVYETDRELRASYYDPVEIDLDDDLLEPALAPISSHWLNTFTTEPIPQYGSFSHIRQHNYVQGDVWTHMHTGGRTRVASGDDEEVEGEVEGEDEDEEENERRGKKSSKGKGKKGEQEKPVKEPRVEIKEGLVDSIEARRLVRSRTLVNPEVDDHLATNLESMPYVPPEMKRRNMKETLLNYEGSFIDIEAWQRSGVSWDNDEDIIGAETVRRLLYTHHMTEERIDRTKVIPQDLRKLYSFLRHRTYPDLDLIFPRDPPLSRLPLDEWDQKEKQATLESRLREKAFNICHKFDCQGVMCPTHYAARERALTEQEAHETDEAQEADVLIRRGRGPQTPRWEKPKLSASQLFAKFKREKRTRCGENCFYSLGVPEHGDRSFDITELDSDPDARTQADIETIWKVDPDAIPCDIAELSWDKVTCRQVYDIRNSLYNYLSEPEPDDDDPGVEERRGGHSGGVSKPLSFTIFGIGSLNVWNDREKILSCVIIIITRADGGPCANVPILMKQWKPTIVKPSQFGNGLFLAGQAFKGDLISDYTGDACLPRTALRRSLVAKANNRNYLFDIPNYYKVGIDAGYAGNESRFANHPNNGHANCSARYIWSGDEKHIALYATGHIWDGNELFLHYGRNFWHSEMPEGNYEGDSPSEQGTIELSSDLEEIDAEDGAGEYEQELSEESVDL
ncbi:unnamed protein product [Rhizoctonia solani]|uniref:SET domain-containing protein n=1 Tax=Rhizoctonia solani TaxID=456999 RepID=A0A8H2XQ39_9AGAM|nr:unnamed protein product [Rhizoctonia solani]